jgi:hypothetical protein
MLKKENDKRKKLAKKLAEISKACEGADDATVRLAASTTEEVVPLKFDSSKMIVWGTAITILLLVVIAM